MHKWKQVTYTQNLNLNKNYYIFIINISILKLIQNDLSIDNNISL